MHCDAINNLSLDMAIYGFQKDRSKNSADSSGAPYTACRPNLKVEIDEGSKKFARLRPLLLLVLHSFTLCNTSFIFLRYSRIQLLFTVHVVDLLNAGSCNWR